MLSLVRDPKVVSAILDRADVGFWTSFTERVPVRVPHRLAWPILMYRVTGESETQG
jgi:hypothetical protein